MLLGGDYCQIEGTLILRSLVLASFHQAISGVVETRGEVYKKIKKIAFFQISI